MSTGRVSGKSKPRGEPILEDEDDDENEDDYENVQHTPRLLAIGYWLLAIGYWLCAPLPCSIMQTYGAIHVRVPLRGIEEKLDAAAGLLPLIADHGFHYVALRLFVPG